jgi:SagB-type dehydrogenase family enzyme
MIDPGQVILEYHDRSKHHLRGYAPGPGYLDWANQPDPFRSYVGAPRIELQLAADRLPTRFNELRTGRLPLPWPFSRDSIAILFELSLAISAWKSYQRTSWALRCNPSSGNLHPTEGYLVASTLPGLEGGVYHYLSRDHVLEQRAHWNASAPAIAGGVLIGIASIYWREAWKYGMRAFRYCQHDCGHAIAAVSYAAASLGWPTRMVDAAADEDVAALLGLDRSADFLGVEREEPDCLLWVGTSDPPALDELVAAARAACWSGVPNRLSAEHVPWSDIDHAHEATSKPKTGPASAAVPVHTFNPSTPRLDLAAGTIFRQRRSAVDFDGTTSISADGFYTMLEALLPRAFTPPWNAWPWPPRVHPALFVHRVEGLEPGLYAFVREAAALGPLQRAMPRDWRWRKVGPAPLPLYLLWPRDARDAAQLICCHQSIAADSCYALGMLASFEDLEDSPWRYRRLYWECGIIGQTLYLEAETAGIRATGIGCFFDDEMHRLLGLEGHEWQSLYHFTAGGALEDQRLTTLPPYGPHAPRAITGQREKK